MAVAVARAAAATACKNVDMRIGPGIQVGTGTGTGSGSYHDSLVGMWTGVVVLPDTLITFRSPDPGTSRFGVSVFGSVLSLDGRDFVRVA